MIKTHPYLGNKARFLELILNKFPRHSTYVEPFGGTGVVLLNKERTKYEVYNDLDSKVVNLYKVLRNKALKDDLLYALDFTPFSYEEVKNSKIECEDLVENARRYLVNCFLSMHGTGRGFQNDSSKIKRFLNYHLEISKIHRRLQGVIIEHRSWDRVCEIYDCKYGLIYMDPPYRSTTCFDKKHYKNNFQDHQKIIDFAKSAKSTVLISGYEDPLYQDQLYGELLTIAPVKSKPKGKRGQVREWIYSNKSIINSQMSLF